MDDESYTYARTDFEMEIIGAILLDPIAAIPKAQAIVKHSDFASDKARTIYKACCVMQESDIPVDLVSLNEFLTRHEVMDKAGGIAYIAELYGMQSTARNVEYHAHIVLEASMRRAAADMGNSVVLQAEGGQVAVPELIAGMQARIDKMVRPTQPVDDMKSIMDVFFRELETDNKGGYETGLNNLDHILTGLRTGKLSIVAARPGIGKSSLMLDIARHVARNAKIGIISLEMDEYEVCGRLLSAEGRIDQGRVTHHNLDQPDWTAASEAMTQIPVHNMRISSTCDDFTSVRNTITKWVQDHDIKIVFIDYLQLIEQDAENRNQAISYISRQLKKLSIRLEIHIMALSQLNRGSESRGDKIPRLSDLRESGAIEQDADIVMLMWREEVEGKETEDTHVYIAKHRAGPKGQADLKFLSAYTTFIDQQEFNV